MLGQFERERKAKWGCSQSWLTKYLKSYGVRVNGAVACVDPTQSHFCSGLECVSVVRLVLVSCLHLLPPPQYKEPPLGMLEECVCTEGSVMYEEGKESVLEMKWKESR